MEIFHDTDLNQLFEIKEPIRVRHIPYNTAEVYGFGKQIRRYGFYPAWLPLCINTDHGVASTGEIYKTEINSSAPVQFYHAADTVALWRSRFKKPCYVLFSPFVFYRRSNKIEKKENAAGTLAFAAHTTTEIDDVSDINNYIRDLKDLPEIYHPVSVCLHYTDVQKGLHRAFLNAGFRVFTAGHPADYSFPKNFYNILSNFKYSSSNIMMSCLFYSVEMGIPHFLYGHDPVLLNKSDINAELGIIDIKQNPKVRQVYSLFSCPHTSISDEQRQFVMRELGFNGPLGRWRMNLVLYRSLILYLWPRLGKIFKKVFQSKNILKIFRLIRPYKPVKN